MPHLHEKFDFVVSAFIVCDTQVALVHHKKIGCWLPIGGHIELSETPDEALKREIKEEFGQEVGKEVTIYQSVEDKVHNVLLYPNYDHHNSMTLLRPWSVEVHDYPGYPGHRHIALVYLASTTSPYFVLSEEHNSIMWFDYDRLDNRLYDVPPRIRSYGRAALREFNVLDEPPVSGPCSLHGLQPRRAGVAGSSAVHGAGGGQASASNSELTPQVTPEFAKAAEYESQVPISTAGALFHFPTP